MTDKTGKINTLAEYVLKISRNTLVINLRFMDKAISMISLVSKSDLGAMAIDGKNIYYDPVIVLKNYSRNKNIVTRQYLHMVFHCVYQHFWVSTLVNQDYWDLACDIAVENTINDIEITAVETPNIAKQKAAIAMLGKNVKYITADMLYKYFMNKKISEKEIEELQSIFSADDHSSWYSPKKREQLQQKVAKSDDSGNKKSKSNQSDSENNQTRQVTKSLVIEEESGNTMSEARQLLQEWKEISKQMKMDIETFSKERGTGGGGLTQNLLAVTREKYDYSAFLKKFAVLGEKMKLNQDEFDYIFYTYGLQMYGKMPLIEPLEYKDVKSVREIVIAIDTSGSTSGELVQKFLQKTYNILKNEESFHTQFNLHIIQCDAEIQEDAKITNQEEFDKYIKHMKIKGLGGTDFRPVFKYVDKMINNKEFSNLKGLIYFTDGYGVFPTKQPQYNAAFVFIEDGYENPKVPAWAIKLVLQEEDI